MPRTPAQGGVWNVGERRVYRVNVAHFFTKFYSLTDILKSDSEKENSTRERTDAKRCNRSRCTEGGKV